MFSKNCLDLDNTPVQRAPGIIWDPPKKDMLCIKGVTKNQTGGGGAGGGGWGYGISSGIKIACGISRG